MMNDLEVEIELDNGIKYKGSAHYYGAKVRVVHLYASPLEIGQDVIVQKLNDNGNYEHVVGYNSFSDDYAFSHAREYALKLETFM